MTLIVVGRGAESPAFELGRAVNALAATDVWAIGIDYEAARDTCLKGGPDDVVRWAIDTYRPCGVVLVDDVGCPVPGEVMVVRTTAEEFSSAVSQVRPSAETTPGDLSSAVDQGLADILRVAQSWPSPRLEVSDRSPRVTVAVAVYNQEKYLHQLMRSVLDEDYQDFEFVLLDDGSTDASPRILAEYARNPKVRVISQPNLGQTSRMDLVINRLVRESRGELISWLGGDDVSLPHHLTAQVNAFDEDPDLGIVHSASWYVDEEGHRLPGSMALRFPYDDFSAFRVMVMNNVVSTPTTMVHRDVFEKVGLHEEGLACDYHFWIKASAAGVRFRYLPQRLMEYRIHGKSLSTTNEGNLACARESIRFRRVIALQNPLEAYWPELVGTTDERVWYEAALWLGNRFQNIDHQLSVHFYGLAETFATQPELFYNRAITHLQLGNRVDAARDAAEAARLDPEYADLHEGLISGRAFRGKGYESSERLVDAVRSSRAASMWSKRRWDGKFLAEKTSYVSFEDAEELGAVALAAWAQQTTATMPLHWSVPTLGAAPETVLDLVARNAAAVDVASAAKITIDEIDDFGLLPPGGEGPRGSLRSQADLVAFYDWMVANAAASAAPALG